VLGVLNKGNKIGTEAYESEKSILNNKVLVKEIVRGSNETFRSTMNCPPGWLLKLEREREKLPQIQILIFCIAFLWLQ